MNPLIVMVIWAASGTFHDRPMVLGGFADLVQCERAKVGLEKKHAAEKPQLFFACADVSPL